MLPTELPYDITFCITEYFDNCVDDRRSLMSLALASKSFLPICQERLFASMTLTDEESDSDTQPDGDKIRHLAHFLESAPHVKPYIRSLTYRRGTQTPERSSFEPAADIISALPKLQELRLSFSTAIDWSSDLQSTGAAKFVKAIQDAVQSPTLTTIHLQLVTNFPLLLFINKCRELILAEDAPSTLSLSVIKSVQSLSTSVERAAFRVRSYEVGKKSWPRRMQNETIDGVECLRLEYPSVPPLDLRFLDRLSVTLNCDQDLEEAKKIRDLAGSIQHLEVGAARCVRFDGLSAFVAGSRSSLQSLTISFAVYCNSDPWSSVASELLLMADRSLHSLKRLTIISSHCSCGLVPNSALEIIDKALSGDAYPALNRVYFTVKVSPKHTDLNISQTYGPYLSRLHKSAKITLSISSEIQN